MKPARDPGSQFPASPGAGRRIGLTLIEVLVVFAILCLIVVLLLPATRDARGAARRTQCRNNLHLVTVALHNYHDAYGALPPAMTTDVTGRPLHSWRTLILPFLDQRILYESIDLSKPWDDPVNADALSKIPMIYRCPSFEGPSHLTTYVAVVGPNACFPPQNSRTLGEITDDRSQSAMVVETPAAAAVPWMAPQDGGTEVLLRLNSEAQTLHEKGIFVAFVDGHVRFLNIDVPAATRAALVTINGSESIEL